MAASDNLPITFFDICENSFYFGVSEAGLQEDDFRCSSQPPKQCWIQSMDRKFLVLKTSGDFKFQDRNLEERQQSDCSFKIQIYQDSSKKDGAQPVMLYTNKSPNGLMVVYCKSSSEIVPENMDLNNFAPPKTIDGTKHEALFYWRKVSCDKYTFESTMYKGHFLAFEPNRDNSCLHKLILCQKALDEVDETCNIVVTSQKS
ncbi:interleukin-18 isoform X2 [Kryptolebias marmoratus]|uniref:interleukin-18 isoform X2 n=1 Tax=Kryptolebias marmoratus TaxID=37003 RepID=UPI0007F8E5D2|nr:interleukin-18 isoform X2 [Kryptolebias marmoratus]